MVIILVVARRITHYAFIIRYLIGYLKYIFKIFIFTSQGLSKKLFNLKFDLQPQQQRYSGYDIDTKMQSSDNNEFVSAVCWKKSQYSNQPSNIILAGNSRGIIKILELV